MTRWVEFVTSEDDDVSSVSRVVPRKMETAPDSGFETNLTASLTSRSDGVTDTLTWLESLMSISVIRHITIKGRFNMWLGLSNLQWTSRKVAMWVGEPNPASLSFRHKISYTLKIFSQFMHKFYFLINVFTLMSLMGRGRRKSYETNDRRLGKGNAGHDLFHRA